MAHWQRPVRATLVEYAAPTPLVEGLATMLRVDRAVVRDQIIAAGERIARTLGLPGNPIVVESTTIRVSDIAGLVRVGPLLELEIAPKFSGTSWDGWREDFFFISMLSRHGRLLTNERIGSVVGSRGDLATLVARAMITMFWENHRRPLRTYSQARVSDFGVDGDVDPESLVLPAAEGYEQRILSYGRRNVFNAAVLGATEVLLPEVREPQTRRQLMRVAEVLAPQTPIRHGQHRRVPSRARRWQSLHDLAVDVLDGFGIAYDSAAVRAPGFVVDTWRVWEDLLTVALRVSLGVAKIVGQRSAALGVRTWVDETGGPSRRTVWVTPDMTLTDGRDLVVDAKYKGRVGDLRNRISEADLYEALAFAAATKRNRVALLYPAVPRGGTEPVTGAGTIFEEIRVGEVLVVGIEVETRGISRTGGFLRFRAGVMDALERVP